MTARRDIPHGIDLLHDPRWNKSTAFTESERDLLNIRGLLPPRVFVLAEQECRVMENFERKSSDLERYIFLVSLQDRNETLFYRTLVDHLERMMPIIYTPTVGEACRQFGHIFRRPRGLYISMRDRGRVADLLSNWPVEDIRTIVVTDGERVLGLGDLGAYGMGIPIGKLALYTACAGVHPHHCLPVMLDVGTDNAQLLEDPLYIGLQHRRVRGSEYDALIEEFIVAVQDQFPAALVQFEDFATVNALRLLERYRDRVCSFNDDVQGTGAVVVAALVASGRLTGLRIRDQHLVFLGAGAAASGIAHMVVSAMVGDGLSREEARRRCSMVDEHGLLVSDRANLFQQPFAAASAPLPDLLSTIQATRPTAIVGVSGHAGGFSEPVIRAMAAFNARPLILALSNPTSHSECTAEQAYTWSGGTALFASGSPFSPVRIDQHLFAPAQANNAYIFPGVGLGVLLAGSAKVTDTMFAAAAGRVATLVTDDELERGTLLPSLSRIREISAEVASAVIGVAQKEGLLSVVLPSDVGAYVRAAMYQPEYSSYV
jgi:malate dehydrogenase (oxaloacetate-decarboxylating)(NADP+)